MNIEYSQIMSLQNLKKTRRLFENNLTQMESPKKFYKCIRSMLSTEVGIPLLRKTDDSLCTSNQQTADLLANEFYHNCSKVLMTLVHQHHPYTTKTVCQPYLLPKKT